MKYLSAIALIVANLIPLFGVLFLGWSLFSVLFLYWLESSVIGLFNIFKMLKAQGGGSGGINAGGIPLERQSRESLISFFCIHFGIFMTVHLMFILTKFGPIDVPLFSICIAFISLFISHAVSYRSNFIGKQEYLKRAPSDLFIAPYGRVIIMHLTVLFGAVVIEELGVPIGALILMIILKTTLDLVAHMIEHSRFKHYSLST